MTAGKAAQYYGINIEKEQEVLMNLANMIIDVYAAESTILRTEKLALKNEEKEISSQIKMSKLFLYKAIKNCNQAGEEVILSFSEGDEQNINDYEVYDSEDYKQIEEQLRMLRLKYPKKIKIL